MTFAKLASIAERILRGGFLDKADVSVWTAMSRDEQALATYEAGQAHERARILAVLRSVPREVLGKFEATYLGCDTGCECGDCDWCEADAIRALLVAAVEREGAPNGDA